MSGLIALQNRQRSVRLDTRWLRRFAQLALGRCRAVCAEGGGALQRLAEVEVAIVSDRVIARVHERFMNLPGATDVITFEHGEIVMSAETARLCAEQHGHLVEEELALYTVHGLLHLNGFEDASARGAARMKKIQSRIVQEVLQCLPTPTTHAP